MQPFSSRRLKPRLPNTQNPPSRVGDGCVF